MNDITLSDAEFSGVNFDGWYRNPYFSGSKVTVIDVSEEGQSLTLYGKWSYPEFNISYLLDSGSNNASNPSKFTVNPNGADATLYAPEKTGYEFDGWYYDAHFAYPLTKKGNSWTLEAGDNVSVYAKWIKGRWGINYIQPAALKDVYNNNPTQYTYGDSVVLKALSQTGYRFDGWFIDAAFLVPATGTGATDTGAKTFYAKWTENEYTLTYVLDADKKTSPDTSAVTNANPTSRFYSQRVTLAAPSNFSRAYNFLGWYDNVNFSGSPLSAVAESTAKNMTLYAKWVKYLWGDVDFDGKVTSADARLVLRAAVGLEKLSAQAMAWGNLDLDKKGALTSADARLVLRMAVHLESVISLRLPEYPEGF